jgi:hypothetical protein
MLPVTPSAIREIAPHSTVPSLISVTIDTVPKRGKSKHEYFITIIGGDIHVKPMAHPQKPGSKLEFAETVDWRALFR